MYSTGDTVYMVTFLVQDCNKKNDWLPLNYTVAFFFACFKLKRSAMFVYGKLQADVFLAPQIAVAAKRFNVDMVRFLHHAVFFWSFHHN